MSGMLLALTGCVGAAFTVAKQAVREVRGAQGELLLITEDRPTDLRAIRGVEFAPAYSTLGSRWCPPRLLQAYDRCANQLLPRLRAYYPGGTPTLTIESEVVYFQKKGLFGAAQMLTRVRMRNGQSLLVDGLLKTESESFREGDEDDLARASVEALGRFLENSRKGVQSSASGDAGRRAP